MKGCNLGIGYYIGQVVYPKLEHGIQGPVIHITITIQVGHGEQIPRCTNPGPEFLLYLAYGGGLQIFFRIDESSRQIEQAPAGFLGTHHQRDFITTAQNHAHGGGQVVKVHKATACTRVASTILRGQTLSPATRTEPGPLPCEFMAARSHGL
ncbi:MAG: hypothetical protein RL434_3212 [Pseudomonadota bacterium]